MVEEATHREPTYLPKIVIVTTSSMAMRVFLARQLKTLAAEGFDVIGVASPGTDLAEFSRQSGVPTYGLRMERQMSPIRDVWSLLRLYILLRRLKPLIVHTHTPKAGLLGMIASCVARVPIRIYNVNGLVFESKQGWVRRLLIAMDSVAAGLSTEVICVSHSLREVAITHGICCPRKARTLGEGSSHGVDVDLFSGVNPSARETFRKATGIPRDAVVLTFVGRLVRDKGVEELAVAWQRLRKEFPTACLLICGRRENQNTSVAEVLDNMAVDGRLRFVDVAPERMPEVYSASDIVVLPTHREGLPNVALECGAMGVPIVTTRVTGCIDAVVDGVTGLLVRCGDGSELEGAVRRLMLDSNLRRSLGRAAKDFVLTRFAEVRFSKLLCEEYRRLLREVNCGQEPVVPVRSMGGIHGLLKRMTDVVGASLGLVLCGPLLGFGASSVLLSVGRPVLFRQDRAGLGGRPFKVLKFRTMIDATDSLGRPLADESRLTRMGCLLRATSIDELPQLWNVLKGEMSLVGPRPLLAEYLPRYNAFQRRRLEVRPGLTGWAQIRGRNALSWDEKFALDVWYVEHGTLWLDLRILAITVWRILRRHGISQPGHETMPEFRGTSAPPAEAESRSWT